MKKLILILMLVYWALGVSAQEKKLTIEKVKKGEEPEQVMDAIQEDFPEAIVKDLSFLPPKLYGQEWHVNVEGELEDVEYYQVNVKMENTDYTAVYDADGKLMSSKRVIHDAMLPAAITETLKQFEGWDIDKTHEIIKYSDKHSSDIYRVKLQKGVEHKLVYLDPTGKIIHERFTII